MSAMHQWLEPQLDEQVNVRAAELVAATPLLDTEEFWEAAKAQHEREVRERALRLKLARAKGLRMAGRYPKSQSGKRMDPRLQELWMAAQDVPRIRKLWTEHYGFVTHQQGYGKGLHELAIEFAARRWHPRIFNNNPNYMPKGTYRKDGKHAHLSDDDALEVFIDELTTFLTHTDERRIDIY
jgi:hypothetical protein